MKKIILFLFFLPVFVFSQGANQTLNFDGTNDYVAVGAIGTVHTIEFWVNSDNLINGSATATPIMSFNGAATDKYIWINNAFAASGVETMTIGYGSGATGQKSYITTVFPAGWNHVAIVSDGTIYDKVYINGLSVTVSASPSNALVANISTLQIGARTSSSSYYNGELDELRFWSTQRTQTQIRDNMCLRVAANATGLIGYYRFDNGSGTTVSDIQTNVTVHNGTATNFAMSGTTSNWVTSGAPIGDASVYNYTGSWAGVTITLASTSNGSFTINTVGGTIAPSGIQLYRVDAAPSATGGIVGLGNNNVYWGNYVVSNVATPNFTYTAVYDYTNYANMNMESGLRVYSRTNNAITTWTNSSATLNTTSNTLTKTAITSRNEFVLSNSSSPLPIELIDFKNECKNGVVNISWTTASETNNDFFTLEYSSNNVNWLPIKIIKGAANSTIMLNYEVMDTVNINVDNYYRLKQTDYDGTFKCSPIIYAGCGKQHTAGLMVSPNPNNGLFNVKNIEPGTTLEIINTFGKTIFSLPVMQTEITLNIPELPCGNYILSARNSQGVKNFKLLIAK